ncbi:MAG TPA: pseudouridine synthase [Chitinophagaceae bacterium]|nr:pseudouridine synthase [Chitinophagaceae bacterium]
MNKYYIIYKPFQVLSRFTAENGKACLKDFFEVPMDVYPVGRLDYDSEGLLLLTNDKSLNHRLLHPGFAHEREYQVQVEGRITDEALQSLASGITINVDGKPFRTGPAIVSRLPEHIVIPERKPPIRFRQHIPTSWIRLVITEGKNRQVRRMTAAVGFPTLRLIRYRMAGLTIDSMLPGDMIEMNQNDLYGRLGLLPHI